jgi:hypothetical protein
MSRNLKYHAATQEESHMPDSSRWRLSLMMFLEYVIGGTWLPPWPSSSACAHLADEHSHGNL